ADAPCAPAPTTRTATAGWRGHHVWRATAAATACAGHRHRTHCRLWNSLPIVTWVHHRIAVAVHSGFGRRPPFRPVRSDPLRAAGHLAVAAAIATALGVLATASAVVAKDLVQAALVQATLV